MMGWVGEVLTRFSLSPTDTIKASIFQADEEVKQFLALALFLFCYYLLLQSKGFL